VGLRQLYNLLNDVLDGKAQLATLDLIQELAEDIFYSSDCAIGYESAAMALKALRGFRDDYEHHVLHRTCGMSEISPVPCRAGCPAEVDIPGYLALIAVGRYDDAIALVRKDNPLAIVCGLVCEHPCEMYCRRGKVDDPINIRGLKRFAADHMQGGMSFTNDCESCQALEATSRIAELTDDTLEPTSDNKIAQGTSSQDFLAPKQADFTGKRVAVIGGGPAGLTAAYYLSLMGHDPIIYEQRAQLGGMLRYGIPSYRLPRKELDREIDYLLGFGAKAKCNVSVGSDITLDELRASYDAIFIAIGAHADKKLNIDGEDAKGVYSAVQLLRAMGDDELPDYSGKRVVVVGGGNVAMDVARTALRLHASNVTIVYRRRVVDMTAQQEEIHAAVAEGCNLLDLRAPVRIESDASGQVKTLVVQPQIIGEVVGGRASQRAVAAGEERIDADIVMVAIGQDTDSAAFGDYGLPLRRNMLVSGADTAIDGFKGIFTGGECVTGPATVIRAVSAGKAAAVSIDRYLGFKHSIKLDIDIPDALFKARMYCARSNTEELDLRDLPSEFAQVELGLLPEEAVQEARRCLRCDHFGLGALRGGRYTQW
jgi:NADPH-dependent glutamate synthase beta subunit-like oxidoreductase